MFSPIDGATVDSRPTFIVDYPRGTLEVELALAPDIRTAGDNLGAFVDATRTNFMLIGISDGPPGIAEWNSRAIAAGAYYWHVRANDYATEDARGYRPPPWSPTRTLRVADEPIVFEGWTLKAKRTSRRPCSQRYRRAYLLSIVVAWSDNDDDPDADYALTLSSGARTLPLDGPLPSDGRFQRLVCTNHTRALATMALVDSVGHVTRGPSKPLRFRP